MIYLNDKTLDIVQRLCTQHPEGPIFRNTDGKPWTPYSIGCRFYRLKDKLGERYALYDMRHGFAERLLEDGVDHLTVAALLGHKDGSMLSKVYSHLNKADSHLARAIQKPAEKNDSPVR